MMQGLQTMDYKLEVLDAEALQKLDLRAFRSDLRRVFDASIPWENPQYDTAFQDQYVEHVKIAVFVRDAAATPLALSIAFIEDIPDGVMLYIAGVWVDHACKSRGLGKLVLTSLIRHATQSMEACLKPVYIALRTQNPRLYSWFARRYDIYPHRNKIAPHDIRAVAAFVHARFSPAKIYEPERMVVRCAFPRGIVVGHLHPSRNDDDQRFVCDHLNIAEGDSYIVAFRFGDMQSAGEP